MDGSLYPSIPSSIECTTYKRIRLPLLYRPGRHIVLTYFAAYICSWYWSSGFSLVIKWYWQNKASRFLHVDICMVKPQYAQNKEGGSEFTQPTRALASTTHRDSDVSESGQRPRTFLWFCLQKRRGKKLVESQWTWHVLHGRLAL